MSMAFNFPLLSCIGKKYEAVDGYAKTFKDAKPETMGQSLYLNACEAGIAYALTKRRTVLAIFLYAQGVDDFEKYKGALPSVLLVTCSRADVRAAMGEPAFSGESGGTGIFAIDHSFDRFEDGAHYFRFECFAADASIRLVTLGTA
jgi:hypothetical protein